MFVVSSYTRNFPMDMLEQDEIFDNLRNRELYWILHNFNKIITPAWYLIETFSSFLRYLVTPVLFELTLLGGADTDFVFTSKLLIPVKVNKVVTFNWLALLLIKSRFLR